MSQFLPFFDYKKSKKEFKICIPALNFDEQTGGTLTNGLDSTYLKGHGCVWHVPITSMDVTLLLLLKKYLKSLFKYFFFRGVTFDQKIKTNSIAPYSFLLSNKDVRYIRP